MTNRERILEQALSLSTEDRAYLAVALQASLPIAPTSPPEPAVASELLAELRRRSAEFRSGTIGAQLASEVLEVLRRRNIASSPERVESFEDRAFQQEMERRFADSADSIPWSQVRDEL
jgi:hypothetical protein